MLLPFKKHFGLKTPFNIAMVVASLQLGFAPVFP